MSELVSRRQLADEIGVDEKAIRQAILQGRVTAIDPATGKLYRTQARQQFVSTSPYAGGQVGKSVTVSRVEYGGGGLGYTLHLSNGVKIVEPFEKHPDARLFDLKRVGNGEDFNRNVPERERLYDLYLERALIYLEMADMEGKKIGKSSPVLDDACRTLCAVYRQHYRNYGQEIDRECHECPYVAGCSAATLSQG